LSAQEIINLKIKDFKKGYDLKTEITTLKLRRRKTEFDFITFLTPEASRAVNDYLDLRDRTIKVIGEKRESQLFKQRVFNEKGYLFIVRHVGYKFLENYDEELRKMEESALMK
jgi:hypothetical protein